MPERFTMAASDHRQARRHKWKRIPCVVVKLESWMAGQFAENEFRKNFTASERAAIGKAIEAELGKRQSQGRSKVGLLLKRGARKKSPQMRRHIATGAAGERTYPQMRISYPRLPQSIWPPSGQVSKAPKPSSAPGRSPGAARERQMIPPGWKETNDQ